MRIEKNPLAHKPDQQPKVNKQPNEQSGQRFSSNLQLDHGIKLSLSEKYNTQLQEVFAATQKLQNDISLIQVAENALAETDSILLKMLDLIIQSNAETTSNAVRHEIQAEIDQLAAEINRIANNTEFNNEKLLNGNFQGKQLYVNANTGQNLTIDIASMTTENLGLASYLGEAVELTSSNQFRGITLQNRTPNQLMLRFIPVAANNSEIVTSTVRDLIDVLRNAGLKVNVAESITDAELNAPLTRGSLESRILPAGILSEEVGVDVTTSSATTRAMELINRAMTQVAQERSKLGDIHQRLQYIISELGTFAQNINVNEIMQRGQKPTERMTTVSKYNFLAQAVNAIWAKVNDVTNSKITFVWFVLFVIILWLIIKAF